MSSKASDGFNDSADEEEEEDEEDDEDILIKPSDLIVSLIRLETSVTWYLFSTNRKAFKANGCANMEKETISILKMTNL